MIESLFNRLHFNNIVPLDGNVYPETGKPVIGIAETVTGAVAGVAETVTGTVAGIAAANLTSR